jgi:hypothetical protein
LASKDVFRASASDIAQGQFAYVFFPVFGILTGVSKTIAAKRCQAHGQSNQDQQRKKQFTIIHWLAPVYIYSPKRDFVLL